MGFADDAFATFARDTFAAYLRVCGTQFARPHEEFGSLSELQSFLAESGDLTDMGPRRVRRRRGRVFRAHVGAQATLWRQFATSDAIVPPCRASRKSAIEIVETCVPVPDRVGLSASFAWRHSRFPEGASAGDMPANLVRTV
ncbi:hypothetical protein PINS_up023265 [Pythium insidiosum]|nr:hypothetical protein PINS_up023265 [Pythium insidiosum]